MCSVSKLIRSLSTFPKPFETEAHCPALVGILCLTSVLLIGLFAWRMKRPISGPVDDSLFDDRSLTSNISPPRGGHATLDEKLRHLAKELGISEGELARSVQRWEEAGNGGERLISL